MNCDCQYNPSLPGCQSACVTPGTKTTGTGQTTGQNTGSDNARTDGGNTGASGSDGGAGRGTGSADGVASGSDWPDKNRKNTTCVGACEWYFEHKDACQCDPPCLDNGDCCDDFTTVCADLIGGTSDGSDDGSDATDGSSTGKGPVGYKFPQPYKVDMLSYNDCKAISKDNYSWCDTFDCKAVVKGDKSWCDSQNSDCKGIASSDRSWCSSKDCKALADARKCGKLHSKGSSELEKCKSEARAWCDSYDCKAMTVGYAGDCKSSNCKAIVKGDASYCFQKRNWD